MFVKDRSGFSVDGSATPVERPQHWPPLSALQDNKIVLARENAITVASDNPSLHAPLGAAIRASGGSPTDFASTETLSDYLISGYWGWSGYGGHNARHFDGNTITVNITNLNATEQALATKALATWSDVANITFNFDWASGGGAGYLSFAHPSSTDAYTAYPNYYGSGPLQSSVVYISSDWLTTDGGYNDGKTGTYSYAFQTYVHEIGHALGLGHSGPYNEGQTDGDPYTSSLYQNDTWQWSIMSYNSQSNYGGTRDYVMTPQMADIYAIQSIYGAATTRTGNTVYGFNSNAGEFYDFAGYDGTPAFTIYDSGGSDTLDASGYSVNQVIDLRAGNWSSIGGYVNNIGIYLTTVIEIAKGGSGNDTITGNSANNTLDGGAGNDTLDGGAGADVMVGGNGNDIYIVDSAQDEVQELSGQGTDLVKASVSYVLSSDDAVEKLTLTGSKNISGVGNSLANILTGNTGNNKLSGGNGNDRITGGDGNDTLDGGSNNDTLNGGSGKDTLTGGLGVDLLTGGSGADRFVFASVSYSGTKPATRDVIEDFMHGADKIDLHSIDANTVLSGDQAFVFDPRGSATSAVARGHIGWYQENHAGTAHDVTILRLNVDNDATIEMTIELHGLVLLTKGDFLL